MKIRFNILPDEKSSGSIFIFDNNFNMILKKLTFNGIVYLTKYGSINSINLDIIKREGVYYDVEFQCDV